MRMSKRVAVSGSECPAMPGAHSIGPTDPHQLIEISIYLRHRQPLPGIDNIRTSLEPGTFASRFGADPAHIDLIRQFAQEHRLHVLDRGDEIHRRMVTVAGTAGVLEEAFGVELNEYQFENGTFRGHEGPVQIPEEIASAVQGVFGLDNRPQSQPHFRYRSRHSTRFGNRASNLSTTPNQIAKLYEFPSDATGEGQRIGIIELGGGFRPADIHDYFQRMQIAEPNVKVISVDHAQNRPSSPESADAVVATDIELAGAVAPGAEMVVYFAPNTARGCVNAMSRAVHDELNCPTVIFCSWGSAERNWTRQAMETIDQMAQEAALLGITVVAAAGGNGSSGGTHDGRDHTDFPASSPYVLACGATRLMSADNVVREVAWNDGPQGGSTGGGYSEVFERPAWQSNVNMQTGRGVPDLALNGAPETGYDILVDGEWEVIGGTSAVVPMCAGLTVLLNNKLNTRLGCFSPLLYAANPATCFRTVDAGANAAFTASKGWNPVTGLGSPIGVDLQQALSSLLNQSAARSAPVQPAS